MKNILLVDDNRDESALLEEGCALAGIPAAIVQVSSIADLHQHLDHLAASASPTKYDVIFIDHTVPGTSVQDLVETVSFSPVTHGVPTYVMSVISRDYDRDRLLSMGVREVYTKPTDIARYVTFIDNLFKDDFHELHQDLQDEAPLRPTRGNHSP